MPVCEIDLRVDGAYRYVWRKEHGKRNGDGGRLPEIVPHERVVCTELFDEAWYAGEALVSKHPGRAGRQDNAYSDSRFQSRETRDGVLKSGMESGVAVSYDRLEQLLASQGTVGMEKGASPS